MKPFIRNHQYNLINKQIGILQHTYRTVSDTKIVESVRYSAQSKIIDAFVTLTDAEHQMLTQVTDMQTAEDFQAYLRSLEFVLEPFPQVTGQQMKKLFHKNKKLVIPNVAALDYGHMTYLGWSDIATNKMFIVYPLNGSIVGIEGKYTPTHKKGVCFICNKHEEVALFSAVSKSRPANASPDYYKAVGNYLCLHSNLCNKNMTDVTALEKFIHQVIGDDIHRYR
ncbi:FusB/FusC family EF-G-binding protein [Paenibacillus rigui]|uniref:Elongation factor G-binding protein n=1 Tax=Paenibacillus rigui TaxID=554312 RepID=A0A229UKJ0_9BACL|nr:FusB/FusC family EF-G-binding protein [Paenibacillus rigui]OXM83429.1 elongation factor G-binding protein [Paenibacillus rigui]